jgi:hypothetical protein
MKELDGKTSDRIRSGEIPPEAIAKGRDAGQPEPPADAVRNAEGHGLGNGATSGRSGGAS